MEDGGYIEKKTINFPSGNGGRSIINITVNE